MIINVKTFYKLQQSEYYENGIWSILLLCPVLDYLFGTLAYIVYGKKIKPFYVMLLWHISATRRHSKIFFMNYADMQNDKSTCNVTVYLYNEKLRFYELISCLLLLFIVLSFSRFTFYATHIYLAWSTFNFNPIQTIQL